jgi:hypothetical protein
MTDADPRHPLVSVVLAVKNGEAHLPDAVESILGQTLSSLELIVIDDGSTDGTWAYLRSLEDSRVRIVRNERNLGVYPSRNRGQRLARGEFIAVHDHDDVSRSDRLEKQVALLRDRPDSVAAGAQVISHHPPHPSHLLTHAADDVALRWEMLFHTPLPHQALTFRRTAAERVGGYGEDCGCAMDYDFECRLAEIGKLCNVSDVLVSAFLRPEGISLNETDTQRRIVRETSRRQMAGLTGRDVPKDLRDRAESMLWHLRVGEEVTPEAVAFCLELARRFVEQYDGLTIVSGCLETLMKRCAESAGSLVRQRRFGAARGLVRTARSLARSGLVRGGRQGWRAAFLRACMPRRPRPAPNLPDVLVYAETFSEEEERRVRDEVSGLDRYNAHVVINAMPPDAVYTHPWLYVLEHPGRLRRRLLRRGMRIVGPLPTQDEERSGRLAHFIRKIDPALVHAYGVCNATRAARTMEGTGRPLVITLFATDVPRVKEETAFHRVLRRAQRIIIHTEAAAEGLQEKGWTGDRIVYRPDRWIVADPFAPAEGPEPLGAVYDRVLDAGKGTA